jgi:hypothetical protein
MDIPTKTREVRLRLTAKRRGYALHRSRRRDPLALGYGSYWITDAGGQLVAGEPDSRNSLDLDAVEAWLNDPGTR